MTPKERVLMTLKHFGMLSTSKIAEISVLLPSQAKIILKELVREGRVKNMSDIISKDYWRLSDGLGI